MVGCKNIHIKEKKEIGIVGKCGGKVNHVCSLHAFF